MPKIRFKRGLEEKLPLLSEGEPGFTTDTEKLFIGASEGNVEFAKKKDVDINTSKIAEHTSTLENLSHVDANAEMLEARGTYPVLGDRLNDVTTQLAEKARVKPSGDTTGVTDTANILTAIATGKKVELASGTFYISGLAIDRSDINITGQGRGFTILQTIASPIIGIEIAKNNYVEGLKISDLTLQGNGSNVGGLKVGSGGNNYVAFATFDSLEITGFAKVDAYGISLTRLQECHFINCSIDKNYDNVIRPNEGFVTTTQFSGSNGHIGHAVRYGIYNLDQTINNFFQLVFNNQILESNYSSAIYSPPNTYSRLTLNECYFENNNRNSGNAVIDIVGTQSKDGNPNYGQSSLIMTRCEFHTNGSSVPNLKTDYVIFRGEANRGLVWEGLVVDTANTRGTLLYNVVDPSGVNISSFIGGLLGIWSVLDIDYSSGHIWGGKVDIQAEIKGLKFPLVEVPSTDPNTLDCYKEGTFTPFAYGTTSAGTGTYTQQSGKYTKIGNIVYFSIVLGWSAHTGTGNLNIGGLPYKQNFDRYTYQIVAETLTYTGTTLLALSVGTTSNVVLMNQTSNSALTQVPMDTSVNYLVINGFYHV